MASLKLVLFLLLLNFATLHGRNLQSKHHKKRKHQIQLGAKQLIVLAPPIFLNPYYKEKFKAVIPFYKRYVEKILEGTDEVVLVVDDETMPHYQSIDRDVLLKGHIDDPWVRDVSSPIPSIDVQFRYVGGSTQKEADKTQAVFNKFIESLKIQPAVTDAKVDGGNLVNNNYDAVITTTKFMKDNNLTKKGAVRELKRILGVDYVSIITPDEPKLAHSDGMAAFVCDNAIYMHKQSEPDFNQLVRDELLEGCPHCTITEVEGFLDKRLYKEGYASSCGVYVNSVVTNNYIYVPQFAHTYLDYEAVEAYKNNPCGKIVVPIDVREVCEMGGSLRCLSWQTEGNFSKRLKAAAASDHRVRPTPDSGSGSGSGEGTGSGEGSGSGSSRGGARGSGSGESSGSGDEYDEEKKELTNIQKEMKDLENELQEIQRRF